MYKAVIVEDEYHLREALQMMIKITVDEKMEIIGFAEDLMDAIELINRSKPNVVFMDVMLKDTTGFEVLSKINHKDFHLIFTTAYEEFAIKAIKFSAIDYLLKPIDYEDLKTAIERIEEIDKEKKRHQWILNSTDVKKLPERIVLPTQEAMHVVKFEQIIRCETSGSYTTFFLIDGKKIIVSKSLKYYEDLLDPNFFIRIHQSHLININYIISYSKEGTVLLQDKSNVPISRSNREFFFSLMKNHS
ncbi:LytTR family DNA-binding domain-containing protein [Chryseobacterium formosus]|uniref:LytTR family DNA-binding domain-containing protein n=1 Tax=Chryseobacterium formosus TaxID=1537363 RepID=A0ABT3XXS6_9FLAO|nr:LytTR family DNA-binding domain-containing protein [Chryseobacterium formosus]MCX8526450.1 LytTR family DNA-binding domain-containing protein [Chryseobacterium formosus]